MNQYEEHCEYELNAQADYEYELWASERESMQNEGYWAECEALEAKDNE